MKKILLLFCGLSSLVVMAQNQDITTEAAAKAAQEAAKVNVAPPSDVPETKNWKFSGLFGLNFSQTGLVNWSAGGNSNFTGTAYANLFLTYKKNQILWASNLDTEIGATYISDTRFPWRKSNDKLNFTTKFGWEFQKKWYLTILGSFKSQYIDGYEYKDTTMTFFSSFLAPSYTDLSIGIDWKPNDIFSIYLSPVAGRITTATFHQLREKYGVAPDKTYKAEVGLTFKAGVVYDKVKNLKILSTLTLFTPYTKKFGNFNVDWDFLISYQFLKVLNVSLSTSLKYYDEVMIELKDGRKGPRVQFKEVLSLGIGYSF